MELIRHNKWLLIRKFASVIIATALIFTAIIACAPMASYAAADKTPEADRTISDLMLGTILALLEIEYGAKLALTEVMKQTYDDNYDRDHKTLANSDRVTPSMNRYRTIAQNAAGYRTSWPENYAETYRKRENAFHDTMRGAAATNVTEADRIKGIAQRWIKNMNEASRKADGYLQLIQAGTQEANYLSMELSLLHADMMRQIDVQMRSAIEEAQDDFDGTSAFEEAVNIWTTPAFSVGGY